MLEYIVQTMPASSFYLKYRIGGLSILLYRALLFFLTCPLLSALAEQPLSLEDCYRLALQKSERLQIREQDIKVAEAQYRQALSLIYPNLSLQVEQRVRDNADFGRVQRGPISIEDGDTPSGGRSGTIGRTQFDAYVSVEQPIFNGFRDYILSEAALQSAEALRFDLKRNKELLFLDVADVFHQILLNERTLEVFGETDDVLRTRIKDLSEFISLGKSRESEVLAAESDRAELAAARERAKGVLQASREILAFLTGVPAAELKLERNSISPAVSSIDEYLAQAQKRNDIRAAEIRIDANRNSLTATERQRWPDISVGGNGYAIEDPDRNREWELLVRMNVPIFEGGRITAEADQARAELESARLVAQERRRISEREVRTAYSDVVSSQAELQSLGKLREAAEKNYSSQKEDYRFGVVTNLEVLQAIRQTLDAERASIGAELALKTNIVRLNVAAGRVAL